MTVGVNSLPDQESFDACKLCVAASGTYCKSISIAGILTGQGSCSAQGSNDQCEDEIDASGVEFIGTSFKSLGDCAVFEPLPVITDCVDCVNAGHKMCVSSARSICLQTRRDCNDFNQAGTPIKSGERTTALSCAMHQSAGVSIAIVTLLSLVMLLVCFKVGKFAAINAGLVEGKVRTARTRNASGFLESRASQPKQVDNDISGPTKLIPGEPLPEDII